MHEGTGRQQAVPEEEWQGARLAEALHVAQDSYNSGQLFYSVGLDGTPVSLGSADWSGWEVRAIGDFSGDGINDLILFHKEPGTMVMCADSDIDSYVSIGQLDADDWFVVGVGDYNADTKDDLLVRQYSFGMLGYYFGGNMSA